jgi:sec-independent protein translocase protein TatC
MGELSERLAPYYPYLEEIRRRVFKVAVAFASLFLLGAFGTVPLLRAIGGTFTIDGVQVVATSPFQLIDLAVSVGMFAALIGTLPLLFYQVFAFLRTGLTRPERRVLLLHVPAALLLFVVGFVYGFAVMYFAMGAIANINLSLGVRNYWDIGQFVSQIVTTAALLGLVFELPLLLNILIRMGLLDVGYLRAHRRHAAVLILVFVALLPPTDGVSLLVMSAPLVLMYELTILVSGRRRQPKHLTT